MIDRSRENLEHLRLTLLFSALSRLLTCAFLNVIVSPHSLTLLPPVPSVSCTRVGIERGRETLEVSMANTINEEAAVLDYS